MKGIGQVCIFCLNFEISESKFFVKKLIDKHDEEKCLDKNIRNVVGK